MSSESNGETVIRAEALGKAYRIWRSPSARLVSPMLAGAARWLAGRPGECLRKKSAAGYEDFHALQNVSFEVKRGEAVGIIGRNGAGKSTLLQLIAGTLQPSAGQVRVNGRVAALLELGAGFNTDFTGRENVFLSGAVLGISQREMQKRFDEIAAFADIGDFMEQPVKTYSSGMMMRLAFAVNTCVDPEILIVDEALSVGDAPFQAKCFRRLRQLIEKGVSLLFVSHDIGTVRAVCSRALWLKNGHAEMWGEAKHVAKEYEKFCWAEQGVIAEPAAATEIAATGKAPAIVLETNQTGPIPSWLLRPGADFSARSSHERYGTGLIRIVNFGFADTGGCKCESFDYDAEAEAWYLLRLNQTIDSDFMVGLKLFDLRGQAVLAVQQLDKISRIQGKAGELRAVKVRVRLPLHHQEYAARISAFGFKNGRAQLGPNYDFGEAVLWDVIESACIICVRPYHRFPLSGPVHLHGTTEIHTIRSD